jgi:pimeloyl-ACP methyl ester carboxylesterase
MSFMLSKAPDSGCEAEMAVLYVPGFMADATLWDELAVALSQFGPAHFADLSQDDSIEAIAVTALSAAPPKFVLVGFSMGGYVAREIARLAPDRVLALVLIASSARGDTPEQALRKSTAIFQVSAGQFKGLSRQTIIGSVHQRRAADKELLERIRAISERLGQGAFLRQSSMKREGDLTRLAQRACPTLVIAASDDRLRFIDEAVELQAGIAAASLELVSGCVHMIPLEAPSVLADMITSRLKRHWAAG